MVNSSVQNTLSCSSKTKSLFKCDLGFGRSATIWSKQSGRVTYDKPQQHTLSLYLSGGTGTRRLDSSPAVGWAGAVTYLPDKQSSTWETISPFKFIHLYVPDQEMRYLYSEIFDKDSRLMDLPEFTFTRHPKLASALLQVANSVKNSDVLAAENGLNEAAHLLLQTNSIGRKSFVTVKGGLSHYTKRRIREFIEENLGETIRLREIAQQGDLSAFHFQRSFKTSFGVTPHCYVEHRRIEYAKRLMINHESLALVACRCGYSSQSHFTRAFKAAVGTSPGIFRNEYIP